MGDFSDNETITFVNKVKSRMDRILDGRKTSSDKTSDYLKYLGYLSDITISYDVLSQTKIGQTLKLLRKHGDEVGQVATDLVNRWKRELKSEDDSTPQDSPQVIQKKIKTPSRIILSGGSKRKISSQSKAKSPVDSIFLNGEVSINELNIDRSTPTLPEFPIRSNECMPSLPDIILPTLYSHSTVPESRVVSKAPRKTRCSSNSFEQFVSNKDLTKVYAGYKGIICTLYELCIRVLEANVHHIERLTFIGFRVIRPLLERIHPDELARLEELNPHLEHSTEHIWEKNCSRTFKRDLSLNKNIQSWKELYYFKLKEKEDRLKLLSSRISSKQAGLKPTSSVKTIDIMKVPRKNNRRVFRGFTKNDDSKVTPLMKRTIQQFKERRQMYKSKPIKSKY